MTMIYKQGYAVVKTQMDLRSCDFFTSQQETAMATSDFLALVLPHQRTIDRLCVEFEDRWIESPHPEIQPLLDRAPAEIQDILLTELLKIEIVYRRRRGESVCPESNENRLPGQLAAIHAAFTAATRGEPIGTEDAVKGVALEFRKLGRLIKRDDFGPYFDAVQTA